MEKLFSTFTCHQASHSVEESHDLFASNKKRRHGWTDEAEVALSLIKISHKNHGNSTSFGEQSSSKRGLCRVSRTGLYEKHGSYVKPVFNGNACE